jgi:DNA-binding MarR family transcriptional regulator
LLKRRAEPGDLRKFRLVLTAAGKKTISQGREAIGVVVAERLSRIATEEVAVFDRIVSVLAGGASISPSTSSHPPVERKDSRQ